MMNKTQEMAIFCIQDGGALRRYPTLVQKLSHSCLNVVPKAVENEIIMSRLYNIDFFCDYDMTWFPFVAQTCFMVLKLGGGNEKLVSLIPGVLKYMGPEELTQYYVKKYSISETILENTKGLSISVTFGRRLLGTVLTVYLPTVLLNIIGHATNFFKPFFFEAVVTVNLTGDQSNI